MFQLHLTSAHKSLVRTGHMTLPNHSGSKGVYSSLFPGKESGTMTEVLIKDNHGYLSVVSAELASVPFRISGL